MVGTNADFCVVDTESAIDRASFSERTLPAAGIEHVFVNGRPIWSEGKHTGISSAGRRGERHSRKWSVGHSLGDRFEPSVAAPALACRFPVKCRAGAEGNCRLAPGNVVRRTERSQKFGRLSKLAWDTSKYSIP
jgi:hypothetical protein